MDIPSPSRKLAETKSPYSKLGHPKLIRILRLDPAQDFSAGLAGLLIPHNLQEDSGCLRAQVQYDALSYCWGKQEFSCTLFLEGETFLNISANLDTCLRHIRDTEDPIHIWIDAVCINQKDVEEKSVQLPMMAQIYSTARTVHIWLGPGHQDVPAVAELLKGLAAVETAFQMPRRCYDDSREDTFYLEVLSDLLRKAFGRHTTLPLRDFLSRPWFARRWILQEAALARDSTIHVGSFTFPWAWLAGGCQTLKASMVKDGFRLGCNGCERTISKVCQISDNKVGILDLLWSYDTSECFDPRDRLYALYSLASDIRIEERHVDICTSEWTLCQSRRADYAQHRHPIRVRVDYGCPWAAVYTEFARSAIESGHSLEILRHLSRFGSLSSVNLDWPSWVPNWGNRRLRRAVGYAVPQFGFPPLKMDHRRIHFRDILFGPVARVVSYAEDPENFLSRLKNFGMDISGLTRAWEQSVSSDPDSWGNTSASLIKDPPEIINGRMPPYSAVECAVWDLECILSTLCENHISVSYPENADNDSPPVLDSIHDTNSPNMRRALRRCLQRLFLDVLPPVSYPRYQDEPKDSEAQALAELEEEKITMHDILKDWCVFYTEGTETDCPFLGIGPAGMLKGDYLWPPAGWADHLVLREQVEEGVPRGSSAAVLRYIGCCFMRLKVNLRLGFRLAKPPGFVKEFVLV